MELIFDDTSFFAEVDCLIHNVNSIKGVSAKEKKIYFENGFCFWIAIIFRGSIVQKMRLWKGEAFVGERSLNYS